MSRGAPRTPSMQGNRFHAPYAETWCVFPDRVELHVNRVPMDLSNEHLPHVCKRWQGASRWSEALDWSSWSIRVGRQAAAQARWPRAVRGEVRRVEVHMHRVHLLDMHGNDGASCKALVDGLKACWKRHRPIKGGPVVEEPGAGLIYDDDKPHLPKDAMVIEQTKVRSWKLERTVVTVWRVGPGVQ